MASDQAKRQNPNPWVVPAVKQLNQIGLGRLAGRS